jgi:NADPH2:quinone reductase
MRAELWEAVAAGELRVPIDSRYALDDVAGALARMRGNQHFGKILLIP